MQQLSGQSTPLDCFYSTQYTEWEYSMHFFRPLISSSTHILPSSVVKPFLTTMEYLTTTSVDSDSQDSNILLRVSSYNSNPHLTITALQGVFYQLPPKGATISSELLAKPPEVSIEAEYEQTTNEDVTMESWDMDEEISPPILSKQPLLPKFSSHLVQQQLHIIITENFCNVCGVPLQRKHVVVDSSEPAGSVSTSSAEWYESHIRSPSHAKIYKEHEMFTKLYDEKYIWMVKEFESLEKLESLSLKRFIDDMKEAIIMFDWKMAEHQTKLAWKNGLSYINEATENFQRLLMIIKQEHEVCTTPFTKDDIDVHAKKLMNSKVKNEKSKALSKKNREKNIK